MLPRQAPTAGRPALLVEQRRGASVESGDDADPRAARADGRRTRRTSSRACRERPVGGSADVDELRASLGGPLPEGPTDPRDGDRRSWPRPRIPGSLRFPGGRYFGFVIGGAVPAALAADWLTSAWDQNAGLYVAGPVGGGGRGGRRRLARRAARRYPARVSFGFVTGCQMAHFTALAAARHAVLARVGWDVNERGLIGAPAVHVVASDERHTTLDRALRFLGLGTACVIPVETDDQGRMLPDALRAALRELEGPTIVCASAGNVNTGSIDPLERDRRRRRRRPARGSTSTARSASGPPRARRSGTWSPARSAPTRWATDMHKWLNVPYDSGVAFCAHPDAHRAAMGVRASYLIHADPGGPRDQLDWNPEFSRRARGLRGLRGDPLARPQRHRRDRRRAAAPTPAASPRRSPTRPASRC